MGFRGIKEVVPTKYIIGNEEGMNIESRSSLVVDIVIGSTLNHIVIL